MRAVALVAALAAAGGPLAVRAEPPEIPGARLDASGRFLNTAGPLERAGPLVTLPFFARRVWGALRLRPGAPERVANDGAWLRQNAGNRRPTVTWVGHATLLVQLGHASFLTDPSWSSTASPVRFAGPRRFVPPGLALDALPPIDFVLISHNHYDHLDIATLRSLAERSAQTVFYVPLGNGALLRDAGIGNVRELDWGETAAEGELSIHCLPAQHWSQRGVFDARRALWSSWAVTGPDHRFYFAGDSGYFDGFGRIGERLGPFDLAALPIGAYQPVAMMKPAHLDPEEAVRAGSDLRASRLLAIHFGTFDLSDEPLVEPPRRFRSAGAAMGFDAAALWVMKIGETREF
jgi:N-acyl-phosphatidylethanolamine-hydrolysing phospholipase D